jgi:magnesium chelatase family protein
MNPCPCGYAGHPQQSCTCSVEQVNRYRAKISGPLLDRIDIVVDVPSLNTNELQQLPNGEDSELIKDRVINARKIQLQRQGKLNYELSNDEIERYCALDDKAKALMQQIIDRNSLSARGYYRQLKLARTIADLAGNSEISSSHLALASQYKRNI